MDQGSCPKVPFLHRKRSEMHLLGSDHWVCTMHTRLLWERSPRTPILWTFGQPRVFTSARHQDVVDRTFVLCRSPQAYLQLAAYGLLWTLGRCLIIGHPCCDPQWWVLCMTREECEASMQIQAFTSTYSGDFLSYPKTLEDVRSRSACWVLQRRLCADGCRMLRSTSPDPHVYESLPSLNTNLRVKPAKQSCWSQKASLRRGTFDLSITRWQAWRRVGQKTPVESQGIAESLYLITKPYLEMQCDRTGSTRD